MAPPALGSGREVSESVFEAFLLELAAHYAQPGALLPPKAALESIGFQVGYQLVERYSRDKPRFTEHLEAIKFICKEFWNEAFKKQVDNLKTNYRGVYVLTDTRFRWLARLAGAPAGPQTDAVVQRTLFLPCGLLRGALAGLGVPAVVTAEPGATLPSCSFTVRVKTPAAPPTQAPPSPPPPDAA